LQEGLGGIRDILIDGSQQFYCDLYRKADIPMRRASGTNIFIAQSPRYAMEALGIAFIAIFAYIMTQDSKGSEVAIPVLGVLALGAQKLLPVAQQLYGAYTNIKSAKTSFGDALDLLEQTFFKYPEQTPSTLIKFEKNIQLKNIGFSYTKNKELVLKNINLELRRGSCIGFMGETGSGKTTLLDIIMGLLNPTIGKFYVDGQGITQENMALWRANIAHVPQNIYLSDDTVERNIAFGVPEGEIDHKRVRKAAKQAQISESIESWENGYQTFVGEQGVRLSGGQCQRIGIARAIYKQASILIFDEATSALDDKTELAVMREIYKLDKNITILIIAHRLSALKKCDQVVKLENGIIQKGSYQEIVIGL